MPTAKELFGVVIRTFGFGFAVYGVRLFIYAGLSSTFPQPVEYNLGYYLSWATIALVLGILVMLGADFVVALAYVRPFRNASAKMTPPESISIASPGSSP